MSTQKHLIITTTSSEDKSYTNRVYFHPGEFDISPCYLRVGTKTSFVYFAEQDEKTPKGQLGMNKIQRITSKCTKRKEAPCEIFEPPTKNFDIETLAIEVKFKSERGGYLPEVDGTEFIEMVLDNIHKHIVTIGQELPISYMEKLIIITVKDISIFDIDEITSGEVRGTKKKNIEKGKVIKDTQLKVVVARGSKLKFSNLPQLSAEGLFKGKASFRDLGIGGLDLQLKTIFRRAFASRIYPKDIVLKFGIQHVKGIMLHGPPGTGKTLTARQIGNILNTHPPKIVNGPEVLNKFVGESERHIRELFVEAEQEYAEKGDDSKLHLIIFDEIDAICKSRGTVRSGTGVNDSVVNQLLSKIDGVESLNNILIIGMTNRIDLIDEALLRSGRFDVKVEIALPNEEGRVQIFDIHTQQMRKNGVLDSDVDMRVLSSKTNNYSGAEIADVCRSAVAFALNKHIHFDDLEKTMKNLAKMAKGVTVKMRDFEKAMNEVKPSFGIQEDEFEVFLSQPLIEYGDSFKSLRTTITSFMTQLQESKRQSLLTVLLAGEKGVGKTSLAVHLACKSKYPFVKMISPQQMIGYSDTAKCSHIVKTFDQAYKSPSSIIIVDNVERIIDYIDMGPRFSNTVLQALLVILKKLPKKNKKLLIIGTTSSKEQMKELNFVDVFNLVLNVPELSKKRPKEIEKVLLSTANFNKKDISKIIESLPSTVSMKKLLLICEMATATVPKGGGTISLKLFLQALIDCGVK